MLYENEKNDSLPIVCENNEEQRPPSQEGRKKKTKIKPKNDDNHDIKTLNENKTESVKSDTESEQTRRNSSPSKQDTVNQTDNTDNENIDLNKNRKDSNHQCELLTQGDYNLNVTNKQEHLFNTTDNVSEGNALETGENKIELENSNSYSSTFESAETSSKRTAEKQTEPDRVSSTLEDIVNGKTNNSDQQSNLDTKDTVSVSCPKQEAEVKTDNSAVEYSDTFQSSSKSKSKTVSRNTPKKVEQTKNDSDDDTLTETSWPSYCQDKSEEANLKATNDKTTGSDVENSERRDARSVCSKYSREGASSVKDHNQISVSLGESSSKSKSDNTSEKRENISDNTSEKRENISDNTSEKRENSVGNRSVENNNLSQSETFPSYSSASTFTSQKERKEQALEKVGESDVSNSAKTTARGNSEKGKPEDTEAINIKEIKTPSDTFTNAQRESGSKNRKRNRNSHATESSNPDDTLEDIEPIINTVAPIPQGKTEKPVDPTLIDSPDNKMARQKMTRKADKNPNSDTEDAEGENNIAANGTSNGTSNGDDGVFSGESDNEAKTDRDDGIDSQERQTSEDKKQEITDDQEEQNEEKDDSSKNDNDVDPGDKENGDQIQTTEKQPDENGEEQRQDEDTKDSTSMEDLGVESVAQIRRNIKIDHAVETVTNLEDSVRELMVNMKDLMQEYTERLNSQPLSDFVMDLDKFKGDFMSLRDAYQKYESLFVFLNKSLKDLRTSGDEVNNLIAKRFRDEDLTTWMDSHEKFEEDKHKLREERIAVERSALAKASEARSSVARAAVSVAESNQMANEAEIEAAEAESLAKKAWEAAQLALKAAEEARIAAIEKRKAEDEARKRAQERAQKKAEEERKIRELENKELMEEAKKKGTTLQDERKLFDEEKARKEAERINPNNWPRYIYSIEPGDYDPGVGCIIRSITGSLEREDVEVTRLEQDTGILELLETEELVSNIIEIKPSNEEKKFNFEQPMSISIPHCAPRGMPGREPVIKTLSTNGKWTELPSNELVLDDIKELRFVETRTRKFGTFAIVLRLKKDTLTFTRKGNKVFSTVDARVSFTCKPSMFKTNTNFNVEVQPVELSAVTDIKNRHPVECGNLLATSPILKFSIPNRKFLKPLLLTMPLPPNTSRPKRPQTAVAISRGEADGQDTRPLTARPSTAFQSSSKEDDGEEEIHLLIRSNREDIWTKSPDIKLFQARNKDIVSFEIKEPHDRYLILRTKENMTVPQIERIAFMVENFIMYRTVQIFLRQKSDDPMEVILSCAQTNRTDRAIKKLAELGYEEGPNPSKDILVKEGQVLDVHFRGNIHCKHQSENLRLIYNTHIRSSLDFRVEEIEKFAQKSFHTYRGFAQIYSDIVNRKLNQIDHHAAGAPKKQPHIEIIKDRLLLTELLMNIPKPEPEPPQPLNTAPVRIHVEAPDTKDVLDFVASELGDEWKLLAQCLNLKSVRIQAILRQNTANPNPKKIRYDMLVSWAKRLPRSANKLEMLASALTACGRSDIAHELRDKDAEYKKHLAQANKDNHLKRAFVKVAQNPDAVRNWMAIARRLGVAEDEMKSIDSSKPSVQEKCFQSLRAWQTMAGEQATIHTLTDRLRKCRYRQLAREIEIIV